MPERRSSRSLSEVSHLFLSGSRPARGEGRGGSVCVWLAVADAGVNRAFCAAGLAAAFARHGMGVSLLEVCDGLPTIGYYFGMERADHLAPVLDRAALLSGSWNGAIRFGFSASASALRAFPGPDAGCAAPHAIVAAYRHPLRRSAAPSLAALREISAALAGDAAPGAFQPDAIVVAGSAAGSGRAGNCAALVRELFPRAAGFIVADRAVREAGAFERIPPPDDLRRSWARRIPPVDPWFDDLASGLMQVVSLRRKATVRLAARR